MRLLIVEDERKVATALREGLLEDWQDVVIEHTGEGAFYRLTTEGFDLVLLDLTLPGRDGLQILTSVRQRGIQTPVLVLSARDTVQDRIAGLDAGADDYLVKPFAFAELMARTRALLRRGSVESAVLMQRDLTIDRVTRRVTLGGNTVDLTAREFDLLAYLMTRPRQVVPRESLAREVWKETGRSSTIDNVIDVHMARLRRKVDADRPVKLIHTIRGVGFMFCEGDP
jgi:two-component system, OmpR family, copper resistance phosphate regulon response regulator CusR